MLKHITTYHLNAQDVCAEGSTAQPHPGSALLRLIQEVT